jgi:hypothetical protein
VHAPLSPGVAVARSIIGLPDIGAFEYHPATDIHPYHVNLVFKLNQNYPNPFNPTTLISFTLPVASYISLIVYNALGQPVHTLVSMFMEPGDHSVNFDAAGLPSGMYFYRLRAGGHVETKRLALIR